MEPEEKKLFILGYELLMLQFSEWLELGVLCKRFCLPVAETSAPTPLREGCSFWYCQMPPALQSWFPQLLPGGSPAGITASYWDELKLAQKSVFPTTQLSFWSCSCLKAECFKKYTTAVPCHKSKNRSCTLCGLMITSTMQDQEQSEHVWL